MDDPNGAATVRRRSGIRSPMLAALPRPSTAGRRQRVTRRGAVFLALGGGVLLAVVITVWRLLPRDGAIGRLLYSLHDTVFLPIKGHAYTAMLPISMIWWGFGALLLALVLASWLSDRSFLRRPHATLTRWLVGMPLMSGWLVAAAHWLRRRRLPCDLLLQVAAHQREAAVRHLLTTPGSSVSATRRAIRLTRLAIELRLLPPIAPSAAVQVAVFWLEGILAARVQRQDTLLTPLLDQASLIAGRLRDAHTASSVTGSGSSRRAAETGFTLAAFARDIEGLAEIERRVARVVLAARGRRDQPFVLAESLTQGVPRSRLRELAVSVDQRRDVLEQARSMIETRRLASRGADGGEILASRLPDLDAAGLALAGQLALDIAFIVADLGEAPGLAEASLEAVEVLALCLELHAALQLARPATSGTPPPPPSLIEQTLIGLVEGLPRPEQYAVCARLAAADPHGRLAVWTGLASAGGVVQPADLALAHNRQSALQLAGGPDA